MSTQVKPQNENQNKLVEIFIPRQISLQFPIIYMYENGISMSLVTLQFDIEELCKKICDSGDLTEEEYEKFMETCMNNLARIIVDNIG